MARKSHLHCRAKCGCKAQGSRVDRQKFPTANFFEAIHLPLTRRGRFNFAVEKVAVPQTYCHIGKSDNAAECHGYAGVVVGELFTADVEGIESIGAVGAVFEAVFLGFGEFFTGFVLAESEASAAHSGRLYGKD